MSAASLQALAFRITAAWEGANYATLQTYDAGIISYGRFQFTLAGGALYRVLNLYIATGGADAAKLSLYLDRVRERDERLKADHTFLNLLVEASVDPIMIATQDSIATTSYWRPMIEATATPFKLTWPLSIAYAFDTAVNLGPYNQNFANALKDLGGKPTERQLVTRAMERRRDELYAQAKRDNLPGLKWRGDFWLGRAQAGDWQLRGVDGQLVLKPGVKVAV